MSFTLHSAQYNTFLQWLKNSYPGLYDCCWNKVMPSANDVSITVFKDHLDAETYAQLVSAVDEYLRKREN